MATPEEHVQTLSDAMMLLFWDLSVSMSAPETCRAGGSREAGAPCVPKGLLDFHRSRMEKAEAEAKAAKEALAAAAAEKVADEEENVEAKRGGKMAEVGHWKVRRQATGSRLSSVVQDVVQEAETAVDAAAMAEKKVAEKEATWRGVAWRGVAWRVVAWCDYLLLTTYCFTTYYLLHTTCFLLLTTYYVLQPTTSHPIP
jgi:hypothetical protein